MPVCLLTRTTRSAGTWVCAVGGLPLFSTEHKFESGTGWPSFYQPIDPDHIIERKDVSAGMVRIEVLCARTGAHLGHVSKASHPCVTFQCRREFTTHR